MKSPHIVSLLIFLGFIQTALAEFTLDFSTIGETNEGYLPSTTVQVQGDLKFDFSVDASGDVTITSAEAARPRNFDITQAFEGQSAGFAPPSAVGTFSISATGFTESGNRGNINANIKGTGLGVQGFNAGQINGGGSRKGRFYASEEAMVWTVDAPYSEDIYMQLVSVGISDPQGLPQNAPTVRLKHNSSFVDYPLNPAIKSTVLDVSDQSIIISNSADSFRFSQPIFKEGETSKGYSISSLTFKIVDIPEPAHMTILFGLIATLVISVKKRSKATQ